MGSADPRLLVIFVLGHAMDALALHVCIALDDAFAAPCRGAECGQDQCQSALGEGIHRLTTTRVADRAGVSVGTSYQYSRTSTRCFMRSMSVIWTVWLNALKQLAQTFPAQRDGHRTDSSLSGGQDGARRRYACPL
jgi:hypothetical protein